MSIYSQQPLSMICMPMCEYVYEPLLFIFAGIHTRVVFCLSFIKLKAECPFVSKHCQSLVSTPSVRWLVGLGSALHNHNFIAFTVYLCVCHFAICDFSYAQPHDLQCVTHLCSRVSLVHTLWSIILYFLLLGSAQRGTIQRCKTNNPCFVFVLFNFTCTEWVMA